METDLTQWLSSDANEGALTLPLRLVELGGSRHPDPSSAAAGAHG